MHINLSDLFWIFIVLSLLQPAVSRQLQQTSRFRLIQQIERKRGSRVIAMIHREETMSLLGFPIVRYIDIQDSEEVLRAIRLTPSELPIDIVLHTPGGLVLAAEQIARALHDHPGRVTVFVPHYAMSGGTLIALAADEIVMDEHAVLGPVDPQLGHYPAVSIVDAVGRKPVERVDDETLILANVAQKALHQVRAAVVELASRRLPLGKAEALADALSGGTWTHDYPITVSEARSLGLAVSTEMPRSIYSLMELYPQAGRRRPSVEYVPLPYRAPATPLPHDRGGPGRSSG
jgi:ClpP class serine protease